MAKFKIPTYKIPVAQDTKNGYSYVPYNTINCDWMDGKIFEATFRVDSWSSNSSQIYFFAINDSTFKHRMIIERFLREVIMKKKLNGIEFKGKIYYNKQGAVYTTKFTNEE